MLVFNASHQVDSDLSYGFVYYLFWHIEQIWENSFNKNGGMWIVISHTNKRNRIFNSKDVSSIMIKMIMILTIYDNSLKYYL